MKDERIALVDLDSTIADYDGSMMPKMDDLRSPGEEAFAGRYDGNEEPPHIEARRKLIQSVPGFWRELKPLATGFRILTELEAIGFIIHVLTKDPKKMPLAWGEKLQWCQQYVPNALVTVTADKSGQYGRVLVDDYPPYFTEWLSVRPRGFVVCVAQPWNLAYAPGGRLENPQVMRYDHSMEVGQHTLLRERLVAAYNRKGGDNG